MSRKHFVALAATIREHIHSKNEREAFARALLPVLRESNPNFNATRFFDAATGV